MDIFDRVIEAKAKEKVTEFEFVYYRGQLNEKLLELNSVEVPDWMKLEVSKSYSKMQNKNWDELTEEDRVKILDDMDKKLTLSFLLDRIKDKEIEAVMSNEEIIGTINANIHKFPNKIKEQLNKGTNPNLTSQIATEIQDEFLMKWLINKSVIETEKE